MKVSEPYTVVFLGQTGFGKSSLINALFNARFRTDPLVSCTKELYSVTVLPPDSGRLITVFDTPGIGEFSDNSRYGVYYDYAVSRADCVVLVVSLDRTDSTAQELLENLRPFVKDDSVKFIIAINRIDSAGVGGDSKSYLAWNDNINTPSDAARDRINRRLATVRDNFNDIFLPFEIIPVCATRNYGIEQLYNTIIDRHGQ